eukprot:1206430-Pyramimonas_sp.AAC.1
MRCPLVNIGADGNIMRLLRLNVQPMQNYYATWQLRGRGGEMQYPLGRPESIRAWVRLPRFGS